LPNHTTFATREHAGPALSLELAVLVPTRNEAAKPLFPLRLGGGA